MEIEASAHENLGGFLRFLARLDPTAQVLDEPGVLAVRGALDFPTSRMAMPLGDPLPADEFADRACEFLLRDGGNSACVYARAEADHELVDLLAARGFAEYTRSPEMVCEARLDDRPAPPGVQVRPAETADDVRAYAMIAGHAFRHLQLPEQITRDTIDNSDVMLEPGVAVALADVDGRPVAGACSVLVGPEPNGYVGWVGCLDEARGHGLGDVVTRRVTNEAFDRGASIVTLEASHFGESTYARMGYRELYRYALMIKL